MMKTHDYIALEEQYGAHNYHPLDVVIERAPVDSAIAAGMIERLRIRRHARDDAGPLPVGPAAEFVVRLSELAAVAPWRRFVFEVNPIKWTRDAAVAVDGLLIVEQV